MKARLPAFVFIVALALSCGTARGQLTDAQVDALIVQFNDNSFFTREEATAQLRDQLDLNLLTPAQLGKLRNKATGANTPLEVKHRAGRLLAEWSNGFTPAGPVLDQFVVMITEVNQGLGGYFYKFDSYVGAANIGDPRADRLAVLALRARNALTAGDTANAKAELVKLRDFVRGLNAADYAFLGLYKERALTTAVTQAEVVAKLNRAVDDVQNAIDAIGRGTLNDAPTSRQKVLVQNTGVIYDSLSFQLTLDSLSGAVVSAGLLDVYLPPPGRAYSVPPSGGAFLGSLYDTTANDGLEISGRVRVQIVYGSGPRLDNPLLNPALLNQLQIVRVADGNIVPLLMVSNDMVNGVISGFYDVPSGGLGLDQFGEFALIQVVPEPSSLALFGIGGLCLLGFVVRRRRAME